MYSADVPYANSPDQHDFDQVDHPAVVTRVGYVLVADELASALRAEVILFAISDY
jgi:hypothetical protein